MHNYVHCMKLQRQISPKLMTSAPIGRQTRRFPCKLNQDFQNQIQSGDLDHCYISFSLIMAGKRVTKLQEKLAIADQNLISGGLFFYKI